MRILFIADSSNVHGYRWIRFFADRGHEVHWISLDKIDSSFSIENINYIEVIKSSNKYLNAILCLPELVSLIRNIDPEVANAHYAGLYGMAATLTVNVPLVITAWGSDVIFAEKSWVFGPMVRYMLRKASLVTCDANHMYERIKKLGVDKEKIRIINFGVNTEELIKRDREIEHTDFMGIMAADKIVLSLRNHQPIYDVETLINSIPAVIKEIPQVKFIIAGSGATTEKLRCLAKDIDVLEHIVFTGRYDKDQMKKLLAAADIYISTSLSDAGIAASTAEAMAAELPVVITNTGENELWIDQGENGFLFAAGNSKDVAKNILLLLKDNPLRERIGALGRKTIVDRNDHKNEMKKMESQYYRILDEVEDLGRLVS